MSTIISIISIVKFILINMDGGNKDMKHELEMTKPDYLIEDWPDKYNEFSWLEYVVSVPNSMFLVSTLKANGNANANLQSWGLLLGEEDEYWSLIAIKKGQHTYENILREREWCINYPSYKDYPKCFETIYSNGTSVDEIIKSGFEIEKSRTIKTPRIKESLINLECKLKWKKPLYDRSNWYLFAGKVTHVAIDDSIITSDPKERIKNLQLMYNIRGTVNPLNGDFYGPNSIGIIDTVVKIFEDDGQPKEWKRK